MPPIRSVPVSFGLNGSDTSYCRRSPVPQHEMYRYRSSTDRSISVTSGGQALKPLSMGGNRAGSAASAGMSITFVTAHCSPSRCQTLIDDDRSLRPSTQLTKP